MATCFNMMKTNKVKYTTYIKPNGLMRGIVEKARQLWHGPHNFYHQGWGKGFKIWVYTRHTTLQEIHW